MFFLLFLYVIIYRLITNYREYKWEGGNNICHKNRYKTDSSSLVYIIRENAIEYNEYAYWIILRGYANLYINSLIND